MKLSSLPVRGIQSSKGGSCWHGLLVKTEHAPSIGQVRDQGFKSRRTKKIIKMPEHKVRKVTNCMEGFVFWGEIDCSNAFQCLVVSAGVSRITSCLHSRSGPSSKCKEPCPRSALPHCFH